MRSNDDPWVCQLKQSIVIDFYPTMKWAIKLSVINAHDLTNNMVTSWQHVCGHASDGGMALSQAGTCQHHTRLKTSWIAIPAIQSGIKCASRRRDEILLESILRDVRHASIPL